MDATLTNKADELAKEFAGQATTLNELNDAMRWLMKTALETMLNTELDVHWGRTSAAESKAIAAAETALPTDTTTAVGEVFAKPRNRRNGHCVSCAPHADRSARCNKSPESTIC